MGQLSNENWVSCNNNKNLPKMEVTSKGNLATIYTSRKVLVQTKKDDMFVAECMQRIHTKKQFPDEVYWYSYGTGGRRMRVMSQVVAWMELPEKYKGE